MRRLLLDPLGGEPALAQRTPFGRDLGFSGLHVTTPTILALAQTWLDGGRWQGEQLVPPAFVAAATVPTPASLRAEGMAGDWAHGYGFSFWGASHGYRGDGAFGQFALVLPEQQVAVAITSEVEDMQATLDAVWTHLLPAVDAAVSPAADRQLAARLGLHFVDVDARIVAEHGRLLFGEGGEIARFADRVLGHGHLHATAPQSRSQKVSGCLTSAMATSPTPASFQSSHIVMPGRRA